MSPPQTSSSQTFREVSREVFGKGREAILSPGSRRNPGLALPT